MLAQTAGSASGLLFNSLQYALFLVIVVLCYWLVPRRARPWVLLVSSYAFYATWNPWFCLLLGATTLVNYTIGLRLASVRNLESRRVLVGIAVLWGMGVLVYFKYTDFAIDSVASLARTFGADLSPALLGIALPLGLSFYTFHTLSYVVDVYRRDIEPTRDLVMFGVFVAYFPQLLAGPLTRARKMFPQFAEPPRKMSRIKVQEGLELILLGLFQKVAIADALSTITKPVFETNHGTTPTRNWLVLVLAAIAGLLQFVLDFSGYSNIARGTSKLLGIELPYNFREPLTRSRNLQDYWRRHNMTLFAWFRDYVYRPLRPRATGVLRNSLLVILVFFLSGLWHAPGGRGRIGANYGWILWGIFMGCAVVVDVQVARARDRRRRSRRALAAEGPPRSRRDTRRSPTLGSRARASAYVVAVLSFSMVLVLEPAPRDAISYYREILSFTWAPFEWNTLLLVLYAFIAVIVGDAREHRVELAEGRADPPTIPRAITWATMVGLIVVFSGVAGQPFVYFQF